MTSKKLALVLVLIFATGAVAGGIAYAQAGSDVIAPDDVIQEPSTPPSFDRSFSMFVDGGAFLGVGTEDISKENMSHYGLREVRGVGVTQVVKDSPAEKAGLRKDDVILRFDGESVTSVRKLNRLVGEASADQSVKLTISRNGSEQEIGATLSKRKFENVFGEGFPSTIFRGTPRAGTRIDPGQILIDPPDQDNFVFAFGGNRRIGVSTQSLTKQLADYFGVKDGGLLVTSVNENGPAAKAGLKAGDVITAVDGEKVTSSGDVSRAINKKQDGDVTLTIIRDRSARTFKVSPDKLETPLMRSGRIGTNGRVIRDEIRDQIRNSVRNGVIQGSIVIPQINIPEIPPINIHIPSIVVPATPQIDVVVPRRAPRVRRSRVIII